MNLSRGLFVVAGVGLIGLLVAVYLFLFCVPLESACHMGNADACARLARTSNLSAWLAGAAMALAVGGFVGGLKSRARA